MPDAHGGGSAGDGGPEIGGADWLFEQLSGGRRARREAEERAAAAEGTDAPAQADAPAAADAPAVWDAPVVTDAPAATGAPATLDTPIDPQSLLAPPAVQLVPPAPVPATPAAPPATPSVAPIFAANDPLVTPATSDVPPLYPTDAPLKMPAPRPAQQAEAFAEPLRTDSAATGPLTPPAPVPVVPEAAAPFVPVVPEAAAPFVPVVPEAAAPFVPTVPDEPASPEPALPPTFSAPAPEPAAEQPSAAEAHEPEGSWSLFAELDESDDDGESIEDPAAYDDGDPRDDEGAPESSGFAWGLRAGDDPEKFASPAAVDFAAAVPAALAPAAAGADAAVPATASGADSATPDIAAAADTGASDAVGAAEPTAPDTTPDTADVGEAAVAAVEDDAAPAVAAVEDDAAPAVAAFEDDAAPLVVPVFGEPFAAPAAFEVPAGVGQTAEASASATPEAQPAFPPAEVPEPLTSPLPYLLGHPTLDTPATGDEEAEEALPVVDPATPVKPLDVDDDLAHWFAPIAAVAPIAAAASTASTEERASATGATAPIAPELDEPTALIDTAGAMPAVSALQLPPLEAVPAGGAALPLGAPAGPDAPDDDTGGTKPPRAPRPNRVLIWVAVGLGLVVVLAALFFFGTRLPALFGAAPAPAPAATEKATEPEPEPEVTGPQPVGEHDWDRLGGGECVDPFTGPWAETFTVVDCAAPHTAQLVYRGTFGGDAATPFPGEEALASQINVLCSAPGIIDLTAAAAFPDLQIQGSFPVTAEQWETTGRYYYCFVSRASGEPITASIAGPGPAA